MTSDLWLAGRSLSRTPLFLLVSAGTLAVGLATSSIFFAVVGMLTSRSVPGLDLNGVYEVDYRDVVTKRRSDIQANSLNEVPNGLHMASLYAYAPTIVRTRARAERTYGVGVDGDFSSVFRARPQVGRWLDTARGTREVVISDRLWRDWFGRDPQALGALIRLRTVGDELTFSIVGVAPLGHRGFSIERGVADVWISLDSLVTLYGRSARVITSGVRVFVRPPDDWSITVTSSALTAAATGSQELSRSEAVVVAASTVLGRHRLSAPRIVALTAALLILACASANASSLLVARMLRRRGETATRVALGGSHWRAVRPAVAEATVVTAMASVLAFPLMCVLLWATEETLPALLVPRGLVDDGLLVPLSVIAAYSALAWVGVLVAVVSVVGVHAARSCRASTTLMTEAAVGIASRQRLALSVMVVLQVGVAIVLVVAAGMYIETLRDQLERIGATSRRVLFDESKISALSVDLAVNNVPKADYGATVNRLARAAASVSGVEATAIVDSLPGALEPLEPKDMFLVPPTDIPPAGDGRRGAAFIVRTTPGLPTVLGLRLLRGRDFNDGDDASARMVAVVSQSVAALLWPTVDPIGQRLATPFAAQRHDDEWMSVVGVIEDPLLVPMAGPFDRSARFVLLPLRQHLSANVSMVARSGSAAAAAEPLRLALRSVDVDLAPLDLHTIDSTILAWVGPQRAAVGIAVSLATISLVLAASGVAGVTAFSVAARRREFAVRVSLGATGRGIGVMVLREVVRVVLIGLAVGVLVAALGSRLVDHRVLGIAPSSLATWIISPILLLLVGVIAGWLPAFAAARADPVTALKDL
jgi:putative ABC transport system permease protein